MCRACTCVCRCLAPAAWPTGCPWLAASGHARPWGTPAAAHLSHPLLGGLRLIAQELVSHDLVSQLLVYFEEVLRHGMGAVAEVRRRPHRAPSSARRRLQAAGARLLGLVGLDLLLLGRAVASRPSHRLYFVGCCPMACIWQRRAAQSLLELDRRLSGCLAFDQGFPPVLGARGASQAWENLVAQSSSPQCKLWPR